MYRGPAWWIALLALGLYYLPLIAEVNYPWPPEQDALLLILAGAALGVWLVPEIGSRLSGVEPRPEALIFRAPFFALRVSYRRIRATRPTRFSRSSHASPFATDGGWSPFTITRCW